MQNPETRKEIETMLEGNKTAELEARLRNRIEFGTAGKPGGGFVFAIVISVLKMIFAMLL
jgi:hypothetical protein